MAVIALFFDRKSGGDYENKFIGSLRAKELWDDEMTYSPYIPLFQQVQRVSTAEIYNYAGSLTAPALQAGGYVDCTENVNWIILHDPQPISTQQLDEIQHMWSKNATFANGNGNNRESQALNGRKIYAKGFKNTINLIQ